MWLPLFTSKPTYIQFKKQKQKKTIFLFFRIGAIFDELLTKANMKSQKDVAFNYVIMQKRIEVQAYALIGQDPAVQSIVGWLVGLGFNGLLRQYFSLYRAVSQREGERGKKW